MSSADSDFELPPAEELLASEAIAPDPILAAADEVAIATSPRFEPIHCTPSLEQQPSEAELALGITFILSHVFDLSGFSTQQFMLDAALIVDVHKMYATFFTPHTYTYVYTFCERMVRPIYHAIDFTLEKYIIYISWRMGFWECVARNASYEEVIEAWKALKQTYPETTTDAVRILRNWAATQHHILRDQVLSSSIGVDPEKFDAPSQQQQPDLDEGIIIRLARG